MQILIGDRFVDNLSVSKEHGNVKKYEKDDEKEFIKNNNIDEYQSDILDDFKIENGNFIELNGYKYKGTWFKDKMQCKGIVEFPNGDRYEGEFIQGKFHGFGRFYCHQNGNKYSGQWDNNEKHGQGSLQKPNGEKFLGDFVNSCYHGIGIYFYQNGAKYFGEWKNDQRVNKGIYENRFGELFLTEYFVDKIFAYVVTQM